MKKKPAPKKKPVKNKTSKTKAAPSMPPNFIDDLLSAAPRRNLSPEAIRQTLEFLEKSWPQDISQAARNSLTALKQELSGKPITQAAIESHPQQRPISALSNPDYFDPLDLVRRILVSQDMLFLSRQITYHVSASENLPMIWADRDRIANAFSKMIEHLARRADRSSRINIRLEPFALRNGPGVKTTFDIKDHDIAGVHQSEVLDKLIKEGTDAKTGVSLFDMRQVIVKQHGQVWADIPSENTVVFNVVLPASEESARQMISEHITFKYDISIMNYANVRKRFGIKKSAGLVAQIEHYIKELVRYPIDMVMAVGEKGIITTIYETQKGSAESVASRISQRLGKEDFRIGKKPVELCFKYHLTQVNASTTSKTPAEKEN